MTQTLTPSSINKTNCNRKYEIWNRKFVKAVKDIIQMEISYWQQFINYQLITYKQPLRIMQLLGSWVYERKQATKTTNQLPNFHRVHSSSKMKVWHLKILKGEKLCYVCQHWIHKFLLFLTNLVTNTGLCHLKYINHPILLRMIRVNQILSQNFMNIHM